MSKKDYVAFARMIRSQRHEIKQKLADAQSEGEKLFLTGCAKAVCITVDNLCEIFKSDNANFNADKFTQACEIQS